MRPTVWPGDRPACGEPLLRRDDAWAQAAVGQAAVPWANDREFVCSGSIRLKKKSHQSFIGLTRATARDMASRLYNIYR